MLEWVAISFSRVSSQPRGPAHVSSILPWKVSHLLLCHLGNPWKCVKKQEKSHLRRWISLRSFFNLKQWQKQHSNGLGIHFKMHISHLIYTKWWLCLTCVLEDHYGLQSREWIEGVKAGARKESCLKIPIGLKDGAWMKHIEEIWKKIKKKKTVVGFKS